MKSKLICLMVFLLGTIACGGRNGARGAAQQNYETVDEGSASGVTSTIQGPGETLPPITGTNADTTTNFALNPNGLPPPTQALPPMTSASSSPMPLPASQPQAQTPQPHPSEPATPAPSADTAGTPPPPATTTTVTPEKPQEQPKEEEPPPPADDTTGTEEAPPPPV